MKLEIRHLGSRGLSSSIIELTVTSYFGSVSFTEDVTDLNGRVDEEFIFQLREIADELEEQNKKLEENN